MGSLVVAILILLVVVSIFYRKTDSDGDDQKEKEMVAKLYKRYQASLLAGNKTEALQHGRDYYAYLRNSRDLSAEDERAIENDLSSMNTSV